MAEYVASISYGKDSLAMLYVIKEVLGWPLDRVITAEIWATDDIQADLPPMVEFKDKADEIILKRWGIKVERFCATNPDGSKMTYEGLFYRVVTRSKTPHRNGVIYGFPRIKGGWCKNLKMEALRKAHKSTEGCIEYIGIAADEGERVERHSKKPNIKLPLAEAGWTEQMCRDWCEENDLLSPLYQDSNRGGCWFCQCQRYAQLKILHDRYPELWARLMRWDLDSSVPFSPDCRTVHDIDRRIRWENGGYKPNGSRFRWADLDNAQMNIYQFLEDNET